MEFNINIALDLFKIEYGNPEPIKFKLEVSEDILRRQQELRPDGTSINKSQPNGCVVFPTYQNDERVILISTSLLSNQNNFVEVLTHEMCHLYDYTIYSNKFLNGDYNKIDEDDWLSFYYYCEFKAKRMGLICESKYAIIADNLYGCPVNYDITYLNHVIENAKYELIISMKKNKPDNVVYNIYRYFAILSFLENKWNEEFANRESFISCFYNVISYKIEKVCELYNHLNNNITTPICKVNFQTIRGIHNLSFPRYNFL